MVIDCHYHLEERVFTREVFLQEMDRAGVQKTALMGSIIGPFPEPPRPLLRLLQVVLESPGLRPIGKLFVANFTPEGDVKILGKAFHIIRDPDNAGVFEAVRNHPDRFAGWVFVNPRGKNNQVSELDKFKGEPGFVGVKAHLFWHHYTPVELLPVAQVLAAIGKPLLVHLGYGEEGRFEALLDKVPDLKLIIAHTGFPKYSETWKAVRKRRNIFLDLSQTTYVSARATREAVEFLGPDRLLFGTDGPFGFHDEHGRYDYGFIKRRIDRLFPQESIRRRLLGENFARHAGWA